MRGRPLSITPERARVIAALTERDRAILRALAATALCPVKLIEGAFFVTPIARKLRLNTLARRGFVRFILAGRPDGGRESWVALAPLGGHVVEVAGGKAPDIALVEYAARHPALARAAAEAYVAALRAWGVDGFTWTLRPAGVAEAWALCETARPALMILPESAPVEGIRRWLMASKRRLAVVVAEETPAAVVQARLEAALGPELIRRASATRTPVQAVERMAAILAAQGHAHGHTEPPDRPPIPNP